MKRLTVIPWTCQRTGDCCRGREVVMTVQEANKIIDTIPAEQGRALSWRRIGVMKEGDFVALKANPCPFLQPDNLCGVYEVRPYNCRRFVCLRPDPSTEPYERERVDLAKGRLGCANLSDRVAADRGARRFVDLIQRKAQRWAIAHGWSK